MKLLSSALQTTLAATGNTLTRCWQIVTRRGVVLGFTKHTRDLTVDGTLFQSLWGIREAAIESHEGLAVDNQELSLFLSHFDALALDAGTYDLARITVFDVDAQQQAGDRILHKVGILGNLTRRDGLATVEVRGPTQFLQTKIGAVYTVTCPVRLGSPRCGVRLQDVALTGEWVIDVSEKTLSGTNIVLAVRGFAVGQTVEIQDSTTNDGIYTVADVTGDVLTLVETLPGTDETTLCTVLIRNGYLYPTTVVSVDPASPKRIFTVATLLDPQGNALPTGFFQNGNVQCLTGDNAGVLAKDIRSHTATTFTLYDEFPFALQVGDELVLEVGCNKRFQEDCITKFNNAKNFQGFPWVPTPEDLFSSPVTI